MTLTAIALIFLMLYGVGITVEAMMSNRDIIMKVTGRDPVKSQDYICVAASICNNTECKHRLPHNHNSDCPRGKYCPDAVGKIGCVPFPIKPKR